MKPELIYVIPNAVDTRVFYPHLSCDSGGGRIGLVVMSRLVYRKGSETRQNTISADIFLKNVLRQEEYNILV